jgi:hypothetical protein
MIWVKLLAHSFLVDLTVLRFSCKRGLIVSKDYLFAGIIPQKDRDGFSRKQQVAADLSLLTSLPTIYPTQIFI